MLVVVNTVTDLPQLTLDTVTVATSTAKVSGFSMTPCIAVMSGSVLASLVIGLYLLATGFLSLLSRAIDVYFEYRYYVAQFDGRDWTLGTANASRLVGDGLFAVGGLAIILGARGLSRLINRVRGYSWDDT